MSVLYEQNGGKSDRLLDKGVDRVGIFDILVSRDRWQSIVRGLLARIRHLGGKYLHEGSGLVFCTALSTLARLR
jgi:hypothetical protein